MSPSRRSGTRTTSRPRRAAPARAPKAAAALPWTMGTAGGSPPACGRCSGCHTNAHCTALVFPLPLPPNLANSRLHWRAKHGQRQAYERLLTGLLYARQLPPVPALPLPRVTVFAELRLGNAMDDDNAVARCKWALDWIVKAGYLEDDRRSVVQWGGFPTQHLTRKMPPQLTLTLIPRETP